MAQVFYRQRERDRRQGGDFVVGKDRYEKNKIDSEANGMSKLTFYIPFTYRGSSPLSRRTKTPNPDALPCLAILRWKKKRAIKSNKSFMKEFSETDYFPAGVALADRGYVLLRF